MASKTVSTSLPLSLSNLENLGSEFCNQEIYVRLVHFWEAKNFNRNILLGVEMLLLDSESNAIQAFITAPRLPNYEQCLKANSIYKLKKFLLKPKKPVYRIVDHKFSIIFTTQTSMVEVPEGDHQIANQKFRIRSLPDLMAVADTDTELYDVIGQVRLIIGDNLQSSTTDTIVLPADNIRQKDRIALHLRMKSGEDIRATLWGDIASSFRSRWNNHTVQPCVVLITTVNPKTFADSLGLNSTSASRLFFDRDVDETNAFMEWLRTDSLDVPPVNGSSSAIAKLETVTVKEINTFIAHEDPQVASLYLVATIVDVLGDRGWSYISCCSCTTKLGKSDTSMYCTQCDKTNNIGLLRYRLEVSVVDVNHDVATLVLFYRDAAYLIGKTAETVLGDSALAENTVPSPVMTLIGRSFKFQVKVTSYNFTAPRQMFSVSRVIDDSAGANLGEENAEHGGMCEYSLKGDINPEDRVISSQSNDVSTPAKHPRLA